MTSGLMRPCFQRVNSVYEQRDALALDQRVLVS